jgi:tetratricopeptide (TPR) repeat protein
MQRSWNGPAFRVAAISLVVGLGLAVPARANDDALRRQVLALNHLTGTGPLLGEYKALTEAPTRTKELLETARSIAKEKDQPLRYHAAYLLALVAAERKDLESSEVFFRICMGQAAKLESIGKIVQSYVGLIELLYDNKKYAASARVCRELLELKTGEGKKREVLIAVTGRFGEEEFVPDDAFDLGKRLRPVAHRLLIQALAKQGKFDKALALADNLVQAQDHWEERQLKGWVLREAGRLDDAAKVYEMVLQQVGKDKELEPKRRELYVKKYQYMLSNIYVDLNQVDKAADLLKGLLVKEPDDPGFNNDLGYIWADHNMNLPEAEKLIRKALDLDRQRRKANAELRPEDDHDNGAYLDSLGWVLFKQKRFEEAKKVMLQAVADKDSQHIEIYDHLGEVLSALGERQAAIDAWRKGVEVAGDSPRERQRKADVEKKLEKDR